MKVELEGADDLGTVLLTFTSAAAPTADGSTGASEKSAWEGVGRPVGGTMVVFLPGNSGE